MEYDLEVYAEINPVFYKLLLAVVFITATETNLAQIAWTKRVSRNLAMDLKSSLLCSFLQKQGLLLVVVEIIFMFVCFKRIALHSSDYFII